MSTAPSEGAPVLPGARALLAFQLLDHWGNRTTPRPAPRADVLAAVLWAEALLAGATGPDGQPARLGRHVQLLAAGLATARSGDPGWVGRGNALGPELEGEPAFHQLAATGVNRASAAVLRLADLLAAHLLSGRSEAVRLPGLPQRAGEAALEVRPAGPGCFRLHPWPLTGRRLTVHADVPADAAGTGVRRRGWTLLPPGAPAR